MAEEVEFVSDEDVPHFNKCGFRPIGRFRKIYQVPLYALTVVSTVESVLVNLKTIKPICESYARENLHYIPRLSRNLPTK